jgi:hypothetical protein
VQRRGSADTSWTYSYRGATPKTYLPFYDGNGHVTGLPATNKAIHRITSPPAQPWLTTDLKVSM